MFCLLTLFLVRYVFCELARVEGWNYIKIHCRDNADQPVDWWYIYKPPPDEPLTPMESGRNFSFIIPTSPGTWETSPFYITSSQSMLKHTLSPFFRTTYASHVAILGYDSTENSNAHGFMLADEMGGIWVGHTVPAFLEIITDRIPFPEDDIESGHMFICLSINLTTLNNFAKALKVARPNITRVYIPDSLKDYLPDWNPTYWRSEDKSDAIMRLNFKTNYETLEGSLVVRPPGNNRCLYKAFALSKKIVLDFYGGDAHSHTICKKEYSIRKISSISLNYPESVYYVNNASDYADFAVSTGAHWQRAGGTNEEGYWTCAGSPNKQGASTKGSLIVCVEDYNVWRSFDLLKVKEPEC